jgi:hypothetical protein
MNRLLILCILFVYTIFGCKNEDITTTNTSQANSLVGTWNLVQLKIDSMIVDPTTERDVLMKLILNSDYSGQMSWADNGIITKTYNIYWSNVVDSLKIKFSSTSPNSIPFYYSLKNNTLNIQFQSVEQQSESSPVYHTKDYIFHR